MVNFLIKILLILLIEICITQKRYKFIKKMYKINILYKLILNFLIKILLIESL